MCEWCPSWTTASLLIKFLTWRVHVTKCYFFWWSLCPDSSYSPKLSVVVVKKRISSRFFAHINGKVSNPPPGTVVDSEVTRPEWYVSYLLPPSFLLFSSSSKLLKPLFARYDFYIVSQAVRTGSVSPTHYNVVYDTSGLKPDHMQRLTYKLCHMYYNWQVDNEATWTTNRLILNGSVHGFLPGEIL